MLWNRSPVCIMRAAVNTTKLFSGPDRIDLYHFGPGRTSGVAATVQENGRRGKPGSDSPRDCRL